MTKKKEKIETTPVDDILLPKLRDLGKDIFSVTIRIESDDFNINYKFINKKEVVVKQLEEVLKFLKIDEERKDKT